jgi:protein gp37
MSQTSKIEWTEATWNPVRGCTKISPGCKNCYAETLAERFRGVQGHPYEQGFDLRLVPEKLAEPMKRRKPTTYFVNSMSDLFHEDVPFEYIAAVFGVMAACPQHTFQVLTKRPERMREWFVECGRHAGGLIWSHLTESFRKLPNYSTSIERSVIGGLDAQSGSLIWPLPNVWLGVSVEDRKYGLPRIDVLRDVPAAVRFLSVEPLLEDLGQLDLAGIDWVIVGGESGRGARPMHLEWVRNLRNQVLAMRVHACLHSDHDQHPEQPCRGCGEAGPMRFTGPALFFKQWGEWCDTWQLPEDTELDDADDDYPPGVLVRIGKKAAGRELDGRTWDEMPTRAP